MLLTTPEEFASQMFCASHRFCNRCRNDKEIRVAIFKNHGIEKDGHNCPLNLPWDTKPKDLPVESRWECPGEPEHDHWLKYTKPKLDQLAADMEFEKKHGRAALLDMKIQMKRAQDYEIEEAQRLAGLVPNSCRLREKTQCSCQGGGWIICHRPEFAASGLNDVNAYNPRWVNIPQSAREDIPADLAARLESEPGGVDRARFRAALETACRAHGGVLPEHRDDCDKCWHSGAQGTRR